MAAMGWCAALGDQQIRCWDGECVVYNPHSGDVHIVTHPVGQLLLALSSAETALTLEQVRCVMQGGFDLDMDEDTQAVLLEHTLSDLQRLSLVMRIND